MRIVLVAGGSGGHIYPCLELAKYFIEKGEKVLLCGSNDSLEEVIYKNNNLEFKGVNIKKKKISNFISTRNQVSKIYKEFNPDAVILFGNYISVSFGIVAILNRIPIYLHEQNVIYGDANILLGMMAKRIYLSLPITKDIYKRKSLLVGNPKSCIVVSNVNLDKSKKNILIAMGSLGSASVNKVIKQFSNECNDNYVYHIVVGKKHYENFIKDFKMRENINIYPYLDNISSYIRECDLFISRAGATTLSEILVSGTASIIIPSPYVKRNHQYKNAKYLSDNGACVLIKEEELTISRLNEEIERLMNDYSLVLKIKDNTRSLAIYDSKNKIYKDIKKDYER